MWGAIGKILGDNKFPHGLTKLQTDTVLEAAAWCADQALRRGVSWDKGSVALSLGQINISQTNPDDHDSVAQWEFLRKKLATVGLLKLQFAKSLPEEEYSSDPALTFRGEDEAFFPLTKDGAKKLYIAKRGQNSLTSNDKSISITNYGTPYDGVNLSINKDVFKNIDKEWNKKIEELAWLVAKRTKEIGRRRER